jgi:nitrogen fixation/metabolism regulation signal transduction histidine kinase
MVIAAPIYLLIAVLGGLLIAKKALQPISKITSTAAEIEKGDLTLRIDGINTKDEVGHLASTFNSCLSILKYLFDGKGNFHPMHLMN